MARFATPYEALYNRPVLSLLPLQPSIIKYTILNYTFTLKKITVFRNVFVERCSLPMLLIIVAL